MFNQEQIDTLYNLVEKGAVTKEDVDLFLRTKLVEIGFVVTPPPAPEVPAEVVPPTPEGEQPAVDPNQPVA
jgi:hypothetical protein